MTQTHRSPPPSWRVPQEFPIEDVGDKSRRRLPRTVVRRPHHGAHFASADLPATKCASLHGRYFWKLQAMPPSALLGGQFRGSILRPGSAAGVLKQLGQRRKRG